MDNQLKITFNEKYIYVYVEGEFNYREILEGWCKIVNACESNNCYYILGEQFLVSSITLIDSHQHAQILKDAGITDKHIIAWIDSNPETYERTKFIETLLRRTGNIKIKLFDNFEKAERWLLEAQIQRGKS